MNTATILRSLGCLICTFLLVSASNASAEESANPPTSAASVIPGPKLKFDSTAHDFGKINAGDVVTHTFWFTNVGDLALTIANVQPSCGCTAAADWTRQVNPGAAGQIPIQFNSANFSGPVTKTVTVISNDTNQPASSLLLKANVWKPVDVVPNYAVITIPPDNTRGSTAVRVINHQEQPLYLQTPEVTNANFAVEVRTNMPGKEYQLIISATDQVKAGNAQTQIKVPTNATNVPPLTVTAYANVQSALTILPAQLNLPAGPLPKKMTPVVTIVNNTTNLLTLSEPTVTVPGVEFQLSEVQPGKYFTIACTFPEGFELTNAANAELKVKSSNPKYAEIRVPIVAFQASPDQPRASVQGSRVPPLTVAPRRVLTRQVNPGLPPPPQAPEPTR